MLAGGLDRGQRGRSRPRVRGSTGLVQAAGPQAVRGGRLGRWRALFLFGLLCAWLGVAAAAGVEVMPEGVRIVGDEGASTAVISPLGRHVQEFRERHARPLDLAAARERLAAGEFRPSRSPVPKLGEAGSPLWLHLSIDNPGQRSLTYRIYTAQGWVDRVDVWVLTPDGPSPRHWAAGDELSPSRHLRPGLGYAFDTPLPPGRSELFLRADSVDAAVLPLRLVPLWRAGALEASTARWIGGVQGFLLALMATFGLLWFGLRQRVHLRYVGYVAACLALHGVATGVAATWLWPGTPALQRYAIPIGMVAVAGAGLAFARAFLGLTRLSPSLDRLVVWSVRSALLMMAVAVAMDAHRVAIYLGLLSLVLSTLAMVGLGVLALRRHGEQATVFLCAAVLAMIGTGVTTLAVTGALPFGTLALRAIDLGVMLEAIVWALALGLRLRRAQHDGARALALAQRDVLTGLPNRRGFLDQALPVWSTAARKSRPLSAVVMDIDHFKHINDRHGHEAGDRVLIEVADRLGSACRSGDILARWGGEEFVLLLPETRGDEASVLAERLRELIAQAPVPLGDGRSTAFTASFGVSVRLGAMRLEDLLRAAEAALHAAKDAGRDRVVLAPDPPPGR